MLLAVVHDNTGVLTSAWTHDELGISILRWMLVLVTGTLLAFLHNAFGQTRKQHLITFGVCSFANTFKLYQVDCL